MTNRISTRLGRLTLKNPVCTASGTFGLEYGDYYDLGQLGAMVSKTITRQERQGNPPPRLFEVHGGLLNSIGLQNPGLQKYLRDDLPRWRQYSSPLLVSVAGEEEDDFCYLVQELEKQEGIAGYEINVSCPNVAAGGRVFGADEEVVHRLVKKLAQITNKELIIKLSPNVTDITAPALAAAESGATALALINTLVGMAIDPQTGKTRIARGVCGYAGPALKPVALALVYRLHKVVNLPLLAMGGIGSAEDALEFFWAGASAVSVGSAQFANPLLPLKIIADLEGWFAQKDLNLSDIIGKVNGIK